MSSSYPSSLDTLSTAHVDDVGEVIHASTINDQADAINKIEAELGTNPSGGASTVAARLGAVTPEFAIEDPAWWDAGDHDSAIAAAIAASVAADGGMVIGNSAVYDIEGNHEFPSGVGLRCMGGNPYYPTQLSGTVFRCQHANACLDFTGNGVIASGFLIDGNDIATNPWHQGGDAADPGGLGRVFIDIHAVRAAQDDWIISFAQNSLYLSCGASQAARDELVLDNGAGGHHFLGCNITTPGRHVLRIQETLGTGPYPAGPSHLKFDDCLLELGGSDPTISIVAGERHYFNACAINGTSTVMVKLDNAGNPISKFDDCAIGVASGGKGIQGLGSQRVYLGDNSFYGGAGDALDGPSGANFIETGVLSIDGGINHYSAGTYYAQVYAPNLPVPVLSDASAAPNSTYLSTTNGKLTFKDVGGTPHALY